MQWESKIIITTFIDHDFIISANYTIMRVWVCMCSWIMTLVFVLITQLWECMCLFLGAEARHGGMCLLMALTDHLKKFWVFVTFYLLLRQLKANQNIVLTLHPLQETNWASTLLICVCVCTSTLQIPSPSPSTVFELVKWREWFEVLALVSPEVALVRAFGHALSCSLLFVLGVLWVSFSSQWIHSFVSFKVLYWEQEIFLGRRKFK